MAEVEKKIVEDSERAGVMLEFAIISPVFITTILIATELLFISYSSLVLEFVAARTARFAAVNLLLDDSTIARSSAKELANQFGITLQDTDVKICKASYPNCSQNVLPEAGKFISIKVTKSFSIFKFQGLTIEGLAVAKREPIQPALTQS